VHRLRGAISPGYGFTGIIIAWLAKLNPFAVVLVSVLFGGLIWLAGKFSPPSPHVAGDRFVLRDDQRRAGFDTESVSCTAEEFTMIDWIVILQAGVASGTACSSPASVKSSPNALAYSTLVSRA
jgi:hypothetical protein